MTPDTRDQAPQKTAATGRDAAAATVLEAAGATAIGAAGTTGPGVAGVTALGLAGAGVLLAGGWAYAAMYPESQIFGRVLVAGDDPREMALTYDDGPNPAATPALLDVLAEFGVRATFFLIGGFARREAALARRVAEAGHAVGCHSMTHPRLAWQSAGRIGWEIAESQRAVEDATGQTVRLFRPPHGARRPLVLRVARDLGMITVQWNVSCEDWAVNTAEAVVHRAERGLSRARRRAVGSNVLLHDGSHRGLGAARTHTVVATRQLIERYGPEGMRFVGIDAWAS